MAEISEAAVRAANGALAGAMRAWWKDHSVPPDDETWDFAMRAALAAALPVLGVEAGSEWTPTHMHYKGGAYRVLGEGHHSETGERLQFYDDVDGNRWARPYEMFHGLLRDGRCRFAALKPLARTGGAT